tara:strand:+ start:10429 stop:10662 length:234 start_codon:yes stop_codon:yes gene_type:complete
VHDLTCDIVEKDAVYSAFKMMTAPMTNTFACHHCTFVYNAATKQIAEQDNVVLLVSVAEVVKRIELGNVAERGEGRA